MRGWVLVLSVIFYIYFVCLFVCLFVCVFVCWVATMVDVFGTLFLFKVDPSMSFEIYEKAKGRALASLLLES